MYTIIPAHGMEAGGRKTGLEVQDHSQLDSEFKACLDYLRSCLRETNQNQIPNPLKKQNTNYIRMQYIPIIPAICL